MWVNMTQSASRTAYIFYRYDPSLAAAVVFVVLFFLTTFFHVFQMLKKRAWYFIPFIVGGFFESIGYIGRVLSSHQSPHWTSGPYIMQSLLLLLAPAFFAASIYMVLGRIILLTDGESHSLIKAKWLTKIFVMGDILSFLTQSSGGALLATAKDSNGVKLGNWIIVDGLILQIIFFGFFIIEAGLFNYRLSSHPTARSLSTSVVWQQYLFVLYSASGLIMIRSTFRVVKYVGGQNGVLLSTEVYLYIFDATLILLNMLILNIWHPTLIITKQTTADLDHNRDYSMAPPPKY